MQALCPTLGVTGSAPGPEGSAHQSGLWQNSIQSRALRPLPGEDLATWHSTGLAHHGPGSVTSTPVGGSLLVSDCCINTVTPNPVPTLVQGSTMNLMPRAGLGAALPLVPGRQAPLWAGVGWGEWVWTVPSHPQPRHLLPAARQAEP